MKTEQCVQQRCFGVAVNTLRWGSSENFDAVLKHLKEKPNDSENSTRQINEFYAINVT